MKTKHPLICLLSALMMVGTGLFPVSAPCASFTVHDDAGGIAGESARGNPIMGQLIVRMKSGSSAGEAAAIADRLKGKVIRAIPDLDLYLIGLARDSDMTRTTREVMRMDGVVSAFQNYTRHIPRSGIQGSAIKGKPRRFLERALRDADSDGLGGIMAAPSGNQWHLNVINWYQVSASLPTATPIVAVVDTGVDYEHPDLAGNVLQGRDFVDDDMDPMDAHGHGTHVAGIIAGNGSVNIRGVSPTTKVLAVRVFDGEGDSNEFDVIAGVQWASQQKGVKVINMSFGGYDREGTPSWNTEKALIDSIVAKGILPVVAAGDEDNLDLYYWQDSTKLKPVPAWFPNAFTVASTTRSDSRSEFSNYNVLTLNEKPFNFSFVDIAAPGTDILSTLPNYQYASWSGTSMATPMVAAAAARYWAVPANAGKTPAQVGAALKASGQALGTSNGFPVVTQRLDLMKALGTDSTGFVGQVFNGQTGQPLSGVVVKATGPTETAQTTTNGSGFFTLGGLVPKSGVIYTLSYAKSGFSQPNLSVKTTAGKLVNIPKPAFMNQNRPTGEYSVIIDWRSTEPGFNEAWFNFWDDNPAWLPYRTGQTAGTFVSPYLRISGVANPIQILNPGSLNRLPFARLTYPRLDPQTLAGFVHDRSESSLVIKRQTNRTYDIYTLLDIRSGSDCELPAANCSDYLEWGSYQPVTTVGYQQIPDIRARIHKGPALDKTLFANSATGTGRYWHVARIDATGNVVVINKLQNSPP